MHSAPYSASRGLTDEVLGLLGSLGSHLEALTVLAGEEAREAAALYLRLALMLAAALFFITFGYVLMLLFIAFLIATIFGCQWIWILLSLASIHLIAAFVCAIYVRTHWRKPVFSATKEEIARDMKALKSTP